MKKSYAILIISVIFAALCLRVLVAGMGGTDASSSSSGASSVAVTSSVPLTVVGTITNSTVWQAEDAGHTSGDKGILGLTIRNDTNTTLTSANLDYSGIGVDKSGRVITAPYTAIEGTVTTVATATSIVATSIAPSNALRNHMTSFQAYNNGTTNCVLAITDGAGGTILAYAFAPANGGCLIPYPVPIRGTAATALFVSNLTAATLYYSYQGYVAP